MKVSAYGKVIVFGEHAVVYGNRALACGLPGGIRLMRLVPTSGAIRVSVPDWDLLVDDKSEDRVGRSLRKLATLLPGTRGMELDLHSALWPKAGLGSSAALSVAVVKALAEARQIDLALDQVRSVAHELEKIFHGQPSGLDDTVACCGGLVLFCRNGLASSRGGRALSSQAIQLDWKLPPLVIANTGVARSTHRLVAQVKHQLEIQPNETKRLFSMVEEALALGLEALQNADWDHLGQALCTNQQCLVRLGVSCAPIDALCRLSMNLGARGAKLTGAGGGGAVIILAPGKQAEMVEALRQEGFEAFALADERVCAGKESG